MTIDPKYLPFFETVGSKGDKRGEKTLTECFHCVSSRLLKWTHPAGFGERDYRPLEVIDLEWKETDKKKKTNQHIARVFCLNLKQYIPQPEFLEECPFFMTPSQYEQKKEQRQRVAERDGNKGWPPR